MGRFCFGASFLAVFACTSIIQETSSCYFTHNGAVRLVGGSTQFEGRVEICLQLYGTWGTICDDFWDNSNAIVVCRQLGLPSQDAVAFSNARFGQGSGLIALDNVNCSGSELTLSSCQASRSHHDCHHSEDAGVRCSRAPVQCRNTTVRLGRGVGSPIGEVEICINGVWRRVCHNNEWDYTEARVVCRQLGYSSVGGTGPHLYLGSDSNPAGSFRCTGSERLLASCSFTRRRTCTWTTFVTCRVACTNYAVRLVGGNTPLEGQVEVCINGAWGTICDGDGWSNADAAVVCRQRGFETQAATSFSSTRFGQGAGPILYRRFRCSGFEKALVHCPSTETQSCNNVSPGVNCSRTQETSSCSNGTVRLQGGTTQFEGRVEICIAGSWGTVCDDFWGNSDATVVCRQLGLPTQGAVSFSGARFGQGRGRIVLDDVDCRGFEETLLSCRALRRHNCRHHEDAGVRCSRPQVNPCRNNTLRLRGGTRPSFGQVEVCDNGTWKIVCHDGQWGSTEAKVVCRQLGYSSTDAVPLYREGSNSNAVGTFRCAGSERSLASCSLSRRHACVLNFRTAGVACIVACVNRAVRLVRHNTSDSLDGRVEVCVDGVWGTVCDDGWSNADAAVVCRQLGHATQGATSFSSAIGFGRGTGPVFYSRFRCSGSESVLLNCPFTRTHTCDHSQDVGVRCLAPCNHTDVRLVGGDTPWEGRVEVCVNGDWGTVCDDGWDNADAAVVCRQLSHPVEGAESFRGARFGRGRGSIFLSNIQCGGSERLLMSCMISKPLRCSHSRDAGVRCQGISQNVVLAVGVSIGILSLFFCLPIGIIILCKIYKHKYRGHRHANGVTTTTLTTLAATASQQQEESSQAIYPVESVLQEEPPPSYNDATSYPQPNQNIESGSSHNEQMAPPPYPPGSPPKYPSYLTQE